MAQNNTVQAKCNKFKLTQITVQKVIHEGRYYRSLWQESLYECVSNSDWLPRYCCLNLKNELR